MCDSGNLLLAELKLVFTGDVYAGSSQSGGKYLSAVGNRWFIFRCDFSLAVFLEKAHAVGTSQNLFLILVCWTSSILELKNKQVKRPNETGLNLKGQYLRITMASSTEMVETYLDAAVCQ